MSEETLRDEIHKRHTLNWLIQGAAQHAGMTFHHMVRDELNALNPKLVRLYDQYALINLLQYWQPDVIPLFGSPSHFWKQASKKSGHPFYGHLLLSKYGGMLAASGRQRALDRCGEKGVTRIPFAFSFQVIAVIGRLRQLEAPHRSRLIELAKRTASTVWGIPYDRLDGELSNKVVLTGSLIPARTPRAMLFRACIVGYGGIFRRGDSLTVVARATNWQLLAKELVKGTAELICLHGLNRLSDDTYAQVMDTADRLELEPWMLQSGGELWRRLVAAVPDGCPMARLLMQLARLPNEQLESVIADVIEETETVKNRLAELVGQSAIN